MGEYLTQRVRRLIFCKASEIELHVEAITFWGAEACILHNAVHFRFPASSAVDVYCDILTSPRQLSRTAAHGPDGTIAKTNLAILENFSRGQHMSPTYPAPYAPPDRAGAAW
jgi:hypothetical protein